VSGVTVRFARLPSPVGMLAAGATDRGVCLLEFADAAGVPPRLARIAGRRALAVQPDENGVLHRLSVELAAYFAGELRAFSVPLDLGGTPFQQRVWSELRAIPYGATRSYGEQAARLGRPGAVRAVARANGDNPVAIVVPCHRVVGADGRLTGYGGGLWRKQRLLELEGAWPAGGQVGLPL
jgi:O-6-methylguanine DNA methyltransferase